MSRHTPRAHILSSRKRLWYNLFARGASLKYASTMPLSYPLKFNDNRAMINLRRGIFFYSTCLNCFFGLARPLSEIRKTGTLKIAMDGATPGFNYFKDGKTLTGFEVDLAKEIAKRMRLKIEWTVQPFNTLLVGLRNDRFDVIGTSLTITPERQTTFDFASPNYCSGATIFSRQGGPKTITDLAGKTVTVPVGTIYYQELKKNKKIKALKTLPQEDSGLQELLSGTADAWVTEKFVGMAALKKYPALQMGERVLNQTNAMVVTKGNDELKTAINQQLAATKRDGTFAALSRQYFAEDIGCEK